MNYQPTLGDFDETGGQTLVECLRAEVWKQWGANHAEMCGCDWPHDDPSRCHLPPPDVLTCVACEAIGDTQ